MNRNYQIDDHENSALDLQWISTLPKPDTNKSKVPQTSESLFQKCENKDQSPATFTQNSKTNTKPLIFKCRNCSVLHINQQAAVEHFKMCNPKSRVSNSGHIQHIDEKVHPKQQLQTVTLIKCQLCGVLLPSKEQYVNHLKMHQTGVAKSEDSQKDFIVAPRGLKTVPKLHNNQHLEDNVTSFQLDRHSKIQTHLFQNI